MEIQIPMPKSKATIWDDAVPILRTSMNTRVYLSDDIEEPYMYNELCHTLITAEDYQTIYLHINTNGGIVASALTIINSINKSKARVVAVLSGTVASAGTLIALSCDDIIAEDYLQFMIHNYWGGPGGKGHEVKAYVDFSNKELNKTFTEIYHKFVTPEEMEKIIEGYDMWLNADEVRERWATKRAKPKTVSVKKAVAAKKA